MVAEQYEMRRRDRVWPVILALAIILLGPIHVGGQEESRRWERRLDPTQPRPTAFHSTQVISLPTAETLAQGEWQFEIAHRFLPAISEGSDAFWGLDGPVNMRLGLGFAPTDRLMLTLARSNLQDNWDLQAKFRALAMEVGETPVLVAFQGGGAWSTEVPDREAGNSGNFQYYVQLIANTVLADRVALGVVPSYLHNVLLDESDPVQDLYWGLYGQLFLSDVFSLNAEWNFGKNRGEFEHDAGALGMELETGGHFFKIFVSNSTRLNPSQYLAGTDLPFRSDEWRLGFAITRLLRF